MRCNLSLPGPNQSRARFKRLAQLINGDEEVENRSNFVLCPPPAADNEWATYPRGKRRGGFFKLVQDNQRIQVVHGHGHQLGHDLVFCGSMCWGGTNTQKPHTQPETPANHTSPQPSNHLNGLFPVKYLFEVIVLFSLHCFGASLLFNIHRNSMTIIILRGNSG